MYTERETLASRLREIARPGEAGDRSRVVAHALRYGSETLGDEEAFAEARRLLGITQDNGAGPDQGVSSWAPVDLAPIIAGKDNLEPPPTMLARSDGEHLVYAAKIHSLAGEPESGKGWLILLLAAERIAAGEHVLYIDFEDEARTVVGRLLATGLAAEAIVERFHYVRPDEPLTEAARAEVEHVLETFRPALGLIDGLTDARAIHGIDLRDNTEVANWMRGLPMTLRNRGMAVVITDHVTKDSDSRGRWAIGAQHKLAKVDVSYHLRVEEPLGRGLEGRILIRIEKDRPGHVRRLANGRTVAEVIAIGSEDGGMSITIEPAPGQDEDDPVSFRPTGYMEKVSRACEAEPGLSVNGIRGAVSGKNEYIDRAREVLVREEWMEAREDGPAQRHHVLRPYRESEDTDRAPNRAPTAPRGDHAGDHAPVPRPIGGTGQGRGAHHAPDHAPPPQADVGNDGSAEEVWEFRRQPDDEGAA